MARHKNSESLTIRHKHSPSPVEGNILQKLEDKLDKVVKEFAIQHDINACGVQINIPDDFIQVVLDKGTIRHGRRQGTIRARLISFTKEDLRGHTNLRDMIHSKLNELLETVPD